MKKLADGRQFTDGDQQTFHELYLKYRDRVYSICLRMTQTQLHKGRVLLRKLIGGHRHVNSRSVASTA